MAVPDPPLGEGTGPHAFVDDLAAPALAPEDHHHLAKVLRVRDGEPMTVSDGRGRWRSCRFGDELEVCGDIVLVQVPAPAITVGFAMVKGERPELIVQKLTELGVDRIVPFVAHRSVVRPDPARIDKQLGRWRRVAREAAMQSRRATLPRVDELHDLATLAAESGVAAADRTGGTPSLEHPTVLIGPEGGWDPAERDLFASRVCLGTQVLRAETACFAAATILGALRAGIVRPVPPAD